MAVPAPSVAGGSNSSHTLSQAPEALTSPFLDAPSAPGKVQMSALFEAITAGNRHGFLQPTQSIPSASLQLAKSTLDAYAGQVSDEQQQQLKEANRKRKRTNDAPGIDDVLKIRKLHIDGFESSQVWQQARRIIASSLQNSLEALGDLKESKGVQADGSDGIGHSESEEDVGTGADGSEEDEAEDSMESESASDGEMEVDEDELSMEEDGDEQGLEDAEDDLEVDGDLGAEDGSEKEDDEEEESSETFAEDPNGLNDGFFSIDEFNKQSQWFEDRDAKADPNTDAPSDDEEVNWHADPLAEKTVITGKPRKGKAADDGDEAPSDMDDEDDDEGGPAFGNMDLDAPEGASDDEAEGDIEEDMGEFNANDIFYKDFFAPPPRKGSKNSKPRKPRQFKPVKPDDEDIGRAMEGVRRDLFDDESHHEGSEEDALSDASAGNPKSRRSAHERKQAKLAEEIRKLEAENVASKKWTLTGEAKAAARPKDSLLHEDLDFEHVGKPVAKITPEISESIEDLVKRRILAQEFDEVVRRRPDSMAQSNTRRGLVELDDTKAKQSLAELYEEDHVKDANPDTYTSKADEKTRKQEQEVEALWKDLSAQLDALSSWHYKPKPAEPSLTVVADVATISMEDAQPTTAQGVSGGDHTLAPQEIYKAGKETADKGEVVAKSGLPVAKQELSREEKTRRRRRDKERIRKAGGFGDRKVVGKAKAQNEAIGDLKKGGVKVINKKGEVLDMEGKKAKAAQAASSGSFKL